MSESAPDAALLKGFQDPIDNAGQAFRAVLDALAQPGTLVPIDGPSEHPAILTDAAFSVLLTLADFSTPLWLDDRLQDRGAVPYLRFHTGAPVTDDPQEAAFAVFAKTPAVFDLARYFPGTPEYPDRSTTIVLDVESFDTAPQARLSGPGVDGHCDFGAVGLPTNFWPKVKKNATRFPLGVDILLCEPGRIAALPRSTNIEVL